jgi:hypothetical protein
MSFSKICPECGYQLHFVLKNNVDLSESVLYEIIKECHINNTYDSLAKFFQNFQTYIDIDILNNIKCENIGFIKVEQD